MTSSYSFFKNLMIIGFGRLSTQFIGLLLIPVYAHSMNTASYGKLDLAITIAALLLPIATLHIEMAGFRFLIEARGDAQQTIAIVKSLLRVTFAQIALWAMILTILLSFMARGLILPVVLYTSGLILSGMMLQIARGLGRNFAYSIGSVTTAGSTLIATYFLVVRHDGGVQGALVALGTGNVLGGLAVMLLVGGTSWLLPGEALRFSALRPLLRYSLPLIPNSMSWWAIAGLDRVVVALFLSISDVGILAYATRIASILTAMSTIYSLTWSEAASVGRDQSTDTVAVHFRDSTTVFFLGGAVVVAGLGVVLPLITPIQYEEALIYVPWLVGSSVLYAVSTFFGGLYVSEFMSKEVGLSSVMAAVVKVALAFILVPLFGLWGAVVSTGLAFAVLCGVRFARLRRQPFLLKMPVKAVRRGGTCFVLSTIAYYLGNVWVNMAFALLLAALCGIYLVWSRRSKPTHEAI